MISAKMFVLPDGWKTMPSRLKTWKVNEDLLFCDMCEEALFTMSIK